MDGSIAQTAANGYNNRKRTRREGVRSPITVLGEPPAAPPERQGVRRMHKQWMHAGAKGGGETIAGGGREGAWMLMGGRGCNQCSSSSSSRKPVGGKGNESRWRRACKLVAGYCSLWGAKAGAAALATALWTRTEAAPLLHLDCNCKGGWEQRRKEETPIPAQGSQETRGKKKKRERERDQHWE